MCAFSFFVGPSSESSNQVNGEKIGKNASKLLRDGNEIAFGSPLPQPNNVAEDYSELYSVGFMSVINRYDLGYVFRLIAGGPKGGMHAIYDISHELGKGSFASVYKAIHRATGQWYAVKMIQVDKIKKSAMKRDVEKASTFAREISILEKLNHPNICQLKETFFQDDNMSMFKFKTMPILT